VIILVYNLIEMSFVNIWVHAVWGTKNRMEILDYDLRSMLCSHIKKNANEKGILIDTIDGYKNHLHALMSLHADMSISKQMQLIKGESSNWANKSGLFNRQLRWADEYFAASVSENNLEKVRAYIQGQEEHHRSLTFQEECNNFLKHFRRSQG
jgi:putative transposase